jgi:hypothetical protein
MDYRDYSQNPGKYRLFKTAAAGTNIFTNNAEGDISEGTIVGIKFITTARNQLYRRDEPVYMVTLQGGREWGALYGSALTDFVL